MARSEQEYIHIVRALLPPGDLFDTDGDVGQGAFELALARSLRRRALRFEQRLIEAVPGTADQLLPEWREHYNLPNACSIVDPPPTDDQKRAELDARFNASSAPFGDAFWHALAASFGYEITLSRPAGYQFEIDVTNATMNVLRCDTARAGDRLRIFGQQFAFDCLIYAYQHPTVRLTISFSGVFSSTTPQLMRSI